MARTIHQSRARFAALSAVLLIACLVIVPSSQFLGGLSASSTFSRMTRPPAEVILEELGIQPVPIAAGTWRFGATEALPSCFAVVDNERARSAVTSAAECSALGIQRNALPLGQCNPLEQRKELTHQWPFGPFVANYVFFVASDDPQNRISIALHKARQLPVNEFAERYGVGDLDFVIGEESTIRQTNCDAISVIQISQRLR